MATARLSEEEIRRYARHIVLPELGGVGQASAQGGAGTGRRRGRARQPAAALSRRRRRRRAGDGRRRPGRSSPTCSGRCCSRPRPRAGQGRMRQLWRCAAQPAGRARGPRGAARRRQRARAHRGLRSGRRRQRQSGDPARGPRCLPRLGPAAGERLGAGAGRPAHAPTSPISAARIPACAACSTKRPAKMPCRPAPRAACWAGRRRARHPAGGGGGQGAGRRSALAVRHDAALRCRGGQLRSNPICAAAPPAPAAHARWPRLEQRVCRDIGENSAATEGLRGMSR